MEIAYFENQISPPEKWVHESNVATIVDDGEAVVTVPSVSFFLVDFPRVLGPVNRSEDFQIIYISADIVE
jgi:hypothetical protein